ncbi:hypothetical protein H100_04303 [Trichophyton rubrum MR850]|nr:hypothetical protein H100_04303 [Trichophyton rubrum MR850]
MVHRSVLRLDSPRIPAIRSREALDDGLFDAVYIFLLSFASLSPQSGLEKAVRGDCGVDTSEECYLKSDIRTPVLSPLTLVMITESKNPAPKPICHFDSSMSKSSLTTFVEPGKLSMRIISSELITM